MEKHKTMRDLTWSKETTPDDLRMVLTTLGEVYQIKETAGKANVIFTRNNESGLCRITCVGDIFEVSYSSQAQACRGVGALLSGLVSDNTIYAEKTGFTLLGIMLDCSRNAVMTVEHIKIWLQKLALLGYNTVMLYTEETYQLDGEPWFGYLRGAYSAEELREINGYASRLGIEVIPCIQTLGHLEHMLKHSAYNDVKDTSRVLLVGEDKTYELIEKMIVHWKNTCSTNRIHIGMDETHDLGLGRYLDKHGYKEGVVLFNEHLEKVVGICKKHGLKPMIWSDMYFRLGCESREYYDKSTVITEAVVEKIPKEVELVYWDYYNTEKEFYLDWIARHRAMGKEPLMASGLWTWNKYWYDHDKSVKAIGPCVAACGEAHVKEIFFTQWGDNGAYCDHDSAFAGMAYCADKAYGIEEPSIENLEKRFAAVCGGSYAGHLIASEICHVLNGDQPDMWDDPIFETRFREFCKDNTDVMQSNVEKLKSLAQRLKNYAADQYTGDLQYAYQLVSTFAVRYELYTDLFMNYKLDKKEALVHVQKRIPEVVESIRILEDRFRAMWMTHNKPEGLEVIQGRFGMLEMRYRELFRRLSEYINGEIITIAELEYSCPADNRN